jgi:hypothetical protein
MYTSNKALVIYSEYKSKIQSKVLNSEIVMTWACDITSALFEEFKSTCDNNK